MGKLGLTEIRAEVAEYAAAFDPALVAPSDAERVVREASAAINMLETVRALAAVRAAAGGSWRRGGAASPAHDLARKTGTTVTKAKEALDTGEKLASLPALDAAARAGEVSPSQAAPSPMPRRPIRVRRGGWWRRRSGRRWASCATSARGRRRRPSPMTGRGTRRSTGRVTCGSGAAPMAAASSCTGRRSTRWPRCSLSPRGSPTASSTWPASKADTNPKRPTSPTVSSPPAAPSPAAAPKSNPNGKRVRKTTPTKVIVRIDWDALLRGWTTDGEVSEIAGLGPIAVSAVQAMIASGDPFLAGVVTKGHDVVNVFHLGRKPVAVQETALEWLSPTCVTLGCNNIYRLEKDHRNDWADTKVTLLGWLEHHCDHCHDLKTRLGWALVEGHGDRPLVPPDDPRHPRYRGQEPRAG